MAVITSGCVRQAKPASHRNLVRFFKETEADAGEYDVVKAPAGTAPADTVYQITAHFQLKVRERIMIYDYPPKRWP